MSRPEMSQEESSAGQGELQIIGACAHNLKSVDVRLPLGRLIALSGPSGSGKSSLAVDVLYRGVARHLGLSDVERPGAHQQIKGLAALRHVELVDQSPLGRTSRGNPGTYTKAWDAVRKAFS